MPFQSEKQRRYLWANEPEIARDWTDTYGSGIAKALGGRIGFWNGSGNIRQQPHQPRDLLVQNNPYGTRPRYQPPGHVDAPAPSSSGGGGEWSPGVGGTQHVPETKTPVTTGGDRIIDIAKRNKRQGMRDLIAQQQAEKDYTRTGQIKPGPQLGWAGSGVGGGLGSWASQFAGSKIGGGLGSMLFGPWGMLLGSLFGRGVGRRGWQASQTKNQKESLQDILFGSDNVLSSLLNKKKTPTIGGEGDQGIQTIDIKDKYDRLGMKPKTMYGALEHEEALKKRMAPKGFPSSVSLADMSRADFEKLINKEGISGLDLIQSRHQGQEYLDDLSQIGEGAGYIGPTQEELAAGINLGDLTDEVWTGGKGLERMKPSEYENYLDNLR